MADLKWFADHVPADGARRSPTSRRRGRRSGLWGPRARDILSSLTSDDVSHEGFPFARCRTIEIGPLQVLAIRISYVGDLGWELHVPIEQGARLWDTLWEAGEPHGIVPAGIGVYGTTGRIEKGYRAFGFELDAEYDVVEADMAWGKVKDAGLRRQGGARAPPRAGAGGDHVHADRRRPHVGVRRHALHARPRADRDPRRRAAGRRQGPPLVRDHGRRRHRRSASTC